MTSPINHRTIKDQPTRPDRRRWLGRLSVLGAAGVAAAVGATGAFRSSRALAADNVAHKAPRILTLYFTWAGSAGTVANEIHRLVGGDIARIETVTPYPTDYHETTERAKAEREKNERPALKAGLPDPADYDVIVIGHPIWSGRMPNAVLGYLETHDLSGKTVAHFATHGGSGLGQSHEELQRLLPKSQLTEGLAVYGWGGVKDLAPVAEWLRRIGLLQAEGNR